jgi:sigma-B regulation protein RsbU (phosphoserine phosphatase)
MRAIELRYTNAGHNAPIVSHRDGTHDRLLEGGGILGVFPVQEYSAGAYELASGDRVLLFTDGVTEAHVPEGEEFGERRLLELLEKNREASAEELQKIVLQAAGEFCGGHWHDDATLIVIAVA